MSQFRKVPGFRGSEVLVPRFSVPNLTERTTRANEPRRQVRQLASERAQRVSHANGARLAYELLLKRQVARVSVQGVRGQSPRMNIGSGTGIGTLAYPRNCGGFGVLGARRPCCVIFDR